MVFKLQFQSWIGVSIVAWMALCLPLPSVARDNPQLQAAKVLYRQGAYFKAARYAFNSIKGDSEKERSDAYSWITLGLSRAGLHQAASYFFIRTLQMNNRKAIRRVLPELEVLILTVGADLLRNYLVRHTKLSDYDPESRDAFLYVLGKEALLAGKEKRSIQFLSGISDESLLLPFALQMRAVAYSLLGKLQSSENDFRSCAKEAEKKSSDIASKKSVNPKWAGHKKKELEDLRWRCQAGLARVYYEQGEFQKAERAWVRVPKSTFVYTDVLFEQAWNAFAKKDYNRALGRLVSYKSPGLSFVFNSEVEVLRAQTYLNLCLYQDANQEINAFKGKYGGVAKRLKGLLQNDSHRLKKFYEMGEKALTERLHTKNAVYRVINRFVRGPYFQNLVQTEESVRQELKAIRHFNQTQSRASKNLSKGFPGFLRLVLGWRLKSAKLFGGAFVRNGLLDHYNTIVSDFKKIAFIKLEMLKMAKADLYDITQLEDFEDEDRLRGRKQPIRADDQYFWSFNGEFWNDELGDYVFGLESKCRS